MPHLSDVFPDFDALVTGNSPPITSKPTLVLAISARTGSTQLCSVLESMKVFGNPEEIFNMRGVVQNNLKKSGATTLLEYLKTLTNNEAPCFALKTSWGDFAPISTAFHRLFPSTKYIYLDRFDVVAQAVSLYKAIRTGRWHSTTNTNANADPFDEDHVSAEQVQPLMKALITEKFNWEHFFYANRIIAHHIFYELIKDDWANAAAIIAEQFGIRNLAASNGVFARLSGDRDQQLIDRFKQSHGYTWLSI